MVFVDLEKVYNMIPRKLLCPVIKKLGIPQEMLVLIKKSMPRMRHKWKLETWNQQALEQIKG